MTEFGTHRCHDCGQNNFTRKKESMVGSTWLTSRPLTLKRFLARLLGSMSREHKDWRRQYLSADQWHSENLPEGIRGNSSAYFPAMGRKRANSEN
jgi:hypothetical protein